MAKISRLSKAVDGWLDRQGKFYSCKFNHHDETAGKLIRKLRLKHTPEYLGWIRVHSAGCWFFRADEYQGRQYVKVTRQQNKWLLDNGFEIKDNLDTQY
jgi:hypothetical protein